MYREIQPDDVAAARDVLGQVGSFFPAFHTCAKKLRENRRNCSCAACSNIAALSLKAFVHHGEIVVKQVRQFEELAGEPVIVLHRLMKNTVESNEYVLLTQAAVSAAHLEPENLTAHRENVDGFGMQQLWLSGPDKLPQATPAAGTAKVAPAPRPARNNVYRHLPSIGPGIWQSIRAWFGVGKVGPGA